MWSQFMAKGQCQDCGLTVDRTGHMVDVSQVQVRKHTMGRPSGGNLLKEDRMGGRIFRVTLE